MLKNTTLALAIALLTASCAGLAEQQEPDCSGPDHYPAAMAFSALKNAGIVSPDTVDFDHVESAMLVSQRSSKDQWRQVFRVTIPLKSGRKVAAIVFNDASADECSISEPKVYVISKALGSAQD